MTIFVSVASYRDPELIPTLHDCIRMARYPGDLRFGVCWQHGPEEPHPLDRISLASPIRLFDVLYQNSRGACWARAEIQKLYNGEDFYLQIDSHHRFVPDWDATLLNQMERTQAARPVLSTYAAAYSLVDMRLNLANGDLPTVMRLDKITPDGVVLFQAHSMNLAPLPTRARFISGHFLFAPGSIVHDVPYDPELYFTGEEITLAVRAFTHGYDLFHPSQHVLWHEYTRSARAKHWDDHVSANGRFPWHLRDVDSKRKVRKFLTDRPIGMFGCGPARTVVDYERYSGLDFTNWTGTAAAYAGAEPESPP
jgi:hypothetical protein